MSRYDTLTPPTKSGFFKFPPGESQIRIVSEPYDFTYHFDQSANQGILCAKERGCRFCNAGDEPKERFIYRIIDRKDGGVKLAEVGWSIVGAIKDLRDSAQYSFDSVPSYDVFVTKTGAGLQTKYQVLPARHDSPLTRAEEDEIRNARPIEEYIASKVEGIQAGEHIMPTPESRAVFENSVRAAAPAQPISALDAFNQYKKRIADAKTEDEVDGVVSEAVFDPGINPTAAKMIQAAGDARKEYIKVMGA